MNKDFKIIALLGCFSLLFGGISMALPQKPSAAMAAVYMDTTVNKDSTSTNTASVNDLKAGFRNMLDEAMSGVNGAKLNPLAVSFVQNYISKNKKGYESMKQWGQPYFTLMENILEEHGIPKEMKYLSVIESGLKTNALSSAGARGPWAFMPATARLYGLRVNGKVDERTNYFKSTHAAARLLTDLYARYGDWLLVIAAYNGGTGNVDRAIRKSGGSKDFWTLQYFLPNESMNHVKKFIGTHYIFEGEGGVTTVTKDEMKNLMLTSASKLSDEEMNKTTAFDITGRFTSEVILKYTGVDRETFDHFNPNFDNEVALNGKYNLRLPTQKMNIFIAKRYEILDESLQSLLKAAK